MMRVLIVNDDKTLNAHLQGLLIQRNYLVEVLETGEDALQLLQSVNFDVVILEWSLPDLSGETVCKEYRRRGGQTPIILLSRKADVSVLEIGLGAGADDYLTKPFDARVLIARLQSLLRRCCKPLAPELKAKNLVLKPETNMVFVGEQKCRLRPKEAALLEYFLRNPDCFFNARQLLDSVWASDCTASPNTVRTWMGLLRQKLAPYGHKDLIRTVTGAGYILESDCTLGESRLVS